MTPPMDSSVRQIAQGLIAQDLTVRFQGLAAISNVSVSVRSGEVLGLIGPNGAGKTTLVNCLTGFQKPTEGRIFLDGQDMAGVPADSFRRRGVARTFQAGRLFREMSVLENVEAAGVAQGLSRRTAQGEGRALLDWIGLGDKASWVAASLAYTDQRRLGIARALIHSVRYILLDEPAAGMSDAEAEVLMELITAVPKQFDCGVLLIEHNMHMVMNICQRIHVLDGGKTLAEGTPDEIKSHDAVIGAYLGMEA